MSQSIRIICFSASQKRHLAELIRRRGGLPRADQPRCVQWRVRELDWQALRYAELLAWQPRLADLVHAGKLPIADAVILMRLKMNLYDDEGLVESVVDQWYRDPLAPLKYLGSERATAYPAAICEEVDHLIAKFKANARHIRKDSGRRLSGRIPKGSSRE
jgi:hypothetical protein